ncbi:MAG: histidine phosphatase family protein [Chloroflexi bacterium]|nr:MAG: histidine phosphatase family protein [Chloroflexota bacterium]
MELYIIRHAQSMNNALEAEDRANYHTRRMADPALSDIGKQQAKILAEHLATKPEVFFDYDIDKREGVLTRRDGYGITTLYCSAMWRALQTAQPVGEALGLRPQVWVDIHEHGGIFLQNGDGYTGYPGKTRDEVLSEFPNYILPDDFGDDGWWNRGYEDTPSMYGRAIRIARDLRQCAIDQPNERIAMISHGTFIDALLKALFNQLPGRGLFHLHYNTAITHLHFYDDRLLELRYQNRIEHLSAEMVTI